MKSPMKLKVPLTLANPWKLEAKYWSGERWLSLPASLKYHQCPKDFGDPSPPGSSNGYVLSRLSALPDAQTSLAV